MFMITRRVSVWLLVTSLRRLLPLLLRPLQLVAQVVAPPMPFKLATRRTRRLLRLVVRPAWPRLWGLQPWVRGQAPLVEVQVRSGL